MRILLAILCVIPSAWVNANAQIAVGAGNDMIAGVLLFAVLAAVFTMRCMESTGAARLGWGTMALIFMTMNAFISLSGISAVRDTAMDIRAEQQRKAGTRQAVVDQVADLRKLVGPKSATVIKVEMDNAERGWKKDQLRVKWETARQIERLQAQVDGWGADNEPAPSAVDPGIANIAALAVTIFNVKLNERFLAALLSGAFAILLELGADLGPIAIFSLVRAGSRRPLATQPSLQVAEPAKPLIQAVATKPAYSPGAATAHQFLESCTRTVAGSRIQASVLYQHYVAWAQQQSFRVISATLFGTTMSSREYPKEKRGGSWWYCDLELLLPPTGLRVVRPST